jgi:hypothetical protein
MQLRKEREKHDHMLRCVQYRKVCVELYDRLLETGIISSTEMTVAQ